MSISEIVHSLPMERRSLLCELLIEIILDSKKNELSNELVLSILAMWKERQAITLSKTMSLIKTAQETNPKETHILLTKMGLIPSSGVYEYKTING